MRTFSFFHKFYDLSFKETQKGYGYHQISLDDDEEGKKQQSKRTPFLICLFSMVDGVTRRGTE